MIDWLLWLGLCILIVACICDLRTREIPDTLFVVLLLISLVVVVFADINWTFCDQVPKEECKLAFHSISWILGFCISLIISLALFYMDVWGGGDVKLFVALCATICGVSITLSWMFLFILLTAAIGLIYVSLCKQFKWFENKEIPFIPAILLAYGISLALYYLI